jgi:serine phosphatase RsbU (regulator of sigma subunit)
MTKSGILSFFIVLLSFSVFSQSKTDSLIKIIQTSDDDVQILEAYLAWDEEVYAKYPDSSVYLNSKVVELSEGYLKTTLDTAKITSIKTNMASALNNIGSTLNQQGKYQEALKFHERSLAIKKELGNKQGMSTSLNNIGFVYMYQVNITKALEYFHQSLKIREEIGYKRGIAGSLINIGNIYYQQNEFEKSLEYYFRSIATLEDINDKRRLAYAYINIGHIYTHQGKIEEARDYFNKSLQLNKDMNNPVWLADIYNNLGVLNLKSLSYDQAINSFDQSLELYTQVDSKKGMASALNNKAKAYLDLKQYANAIQNAEKALRISLDTDNAIEARAAYENLYQAYEAMGAVAQSYKMFKEYIAIRDSILSEENQKQAIRQEIKYSYEKQATADSIQAAEAQKVLDAQITAQQAQIKQEKTQRIGLIIGLLMVLVFGVFVFHRLQITRKQKVVIEQQKGIVDEKNKEILDSINYAKRIQTAILPSNSVVQDYLPNSFILYMPKDIVAGDFYWMEKKNGQVLFAAADCTGHGVPGAMVSVVCNNSLNRSVREYGLSEPGKILDQTKELVVQEFEKSEEDVQDGMDIALCSLTGKKLKYAGAHNPLWIIRDGEILETKANKQPIGKYDFAQAFETHEFDLLEGDTVYVFSDGFIDQFGGEKGKKLKSKAFKRMLLRIQDMNMGDQKNYLTEAFYKWKGEIEQIDDVCVIGVRV